MSTVGTRELKQNPNAVIQRVLDTGEELEITAHGHPTGVKIVPARHPQGPWVPARALSQLTPMDREDAQAFIDDIDTMREDEALHDPWGDQS